MCIYVSLHNENSYSLPLRESLQVKNTDDQNTERLQSVSENLMLKLSNKLCNTHVNECLPPGKTEQEALKQQKK